MSLKKRNFHASIDGKSLDRIRDIQSRGNPGLLKKVIELYFQETPKLLETLRDASDRRDAKGVQRAAHTLKSSSANLGATGLARMCGDVEVLVRAGELDKARPLVTRIENEYAMVHCALQAEY